MVKKLTVSLDESVIDSAKEYAQGTGRSLSEIVEAYLKSLATPVVSEDVSNRLNRLAGKIQLPENFDLESELREAIERKHLS